MPRLPSIIGTFLLLCLSILAAGPARAQGRGPVVLAASSLQEGLTDAANVWTASGHARPVLSFAGTPALARQIKAGAPADLFVSADEEWMDDVARAGHVQVGTRAAFVSNRLVLVAPVQSKVRLTMGKNFPLARALGAGRLAMADPDSVPAGRYAKAALAHLGVWSGVVGKIARAENVRAALALVERGAAPLGIVYATDARASALVRTLGVFPQTSHPSIGYSLARLRTSRHAEAEGFRRFLLSPRGKAIMVRRGFSAR
jgi:molybdate transport system substrate-binding protein